MFIVEPKVRIAGSGIPTHFTVVTEEYALEPAALREDTLKA